MSRQSKHMLAAAVVVSLCVGTSNAWAVSAPALRTGLLAGVSRPLVPATLTPLARLRARPLHSGWAAKLQTGIVGLPNVGKSTLFNALLQKQTAEAANFPFCTIEPNTGIVSVPDPRLEVLGKLSNSEKVIPATMEFTDIAGIVKGASEGAGLGNKFLANIRECDAIIHVVRCFENVEVINLELVLADMAQVDKRLERLAKDMKRVASPENKLEHGCLSKIKVLLDDGLPARQAQCDEEELKAIRSLGLLTLKPIIYAANVVDEELASGNEMVEKVREYAAKEGAEVVIVSAQVESEIAELSSEEKAEFLDALGVTDPNSCGLNALTRQAFRLLNL